MIGVTPSWRAVLRVAPLLAVLAFASAAPASAQDGGRWEVDTTEPVYRGVRANAPVAKEHHIRNEGGIDGAGLCVIASNTSDGLSQEVPEFAGGKACDIWRNAKRAPGGYSPDKLDRLFQRSNMATRYVSATGSLSELLPLIEHYTQRGVPVATTMNTGKKYGWAYIHHMVQTVHLDAEVACIVDNNFPGVFTWMSRAEYERRLIDGPSGWVVVFLKFKALAGWGRYLRIAAVAAAGAFAAFVLLCVAGGFVVAALRRARR